jgi:hypothetical protein
MKIFFITDLEGIAGAERWEQTREEGALKKQSMVQLTKEVFVSSFERPLELIPSTPEVTQDWKRRSTFVLMAY